MSFTFINITMCSNIWSPHLTHFTNWGGKAEVHVRLPGFYVCVLVKVMTEEWTKYVCFLTWGATRYPGKIHSHVRICRTPGLRWSAHYWVLPQLKVNVHSGIHEVFKSTDVKVTFTHYKKYILRKKLCQQFFSKCTLVTFHQWSCVFYVVVDQTFCVDHHEITILQLITLQSQFFLLYIRGISYYEYIRQLAY